MGRRKRIYESERTKDIYPSFSCGNSAFGNGAYVPDPCAGGAGSADGLPAVCHADHHYYIHEGVEYCDDPGQYEKGTMR